jgi:hypothetical protein
MSNVKKLMMTAAGGGEALNVEDLFSTYLYRGDGSSSGHTQTTGVDILGEGGVTWIKSRTNAEGNNFYYNDGGTPRYVKTDSTASRVSPSDFLPTLYGLYEWTNTGFTLGRTFAGENTNNQNYTSWSFRKAPKFFDMVFYTGNGTNRTISHNLGSTPGCMFIKAVTGNYAWAVYHRGHPSPQYQYSWLQSTQPVGTLANYWNSTDPTDSVFSLGTNGTVNANGVEYVAFIFAHNDGDGEFGPNADQDIIKCGSYTGSNSQELNIGFEPQWILIKKTDAASDWVIFDNMRGMSDTNNRHLRPNNINAEISNSSGSVIPTPQGIQFDANTISEINSGGDDFIYIAIRRGPMAVPESASEVFAIDTRTAVSSNTSTDPAFSAGFAPDMAIERTVNTATNNLIASRLTQSKLLYTNLTNSQGSNTSGVYYFDKENGWFGLTSSNSNDYSWMWKRAPTFFDVVAWTGSSASTRTLNHNLGVAPEMIWAKNRKDFDPWYCYHTETGNTKTIPFSASTPTVSSAVWNNTTPSASTFSVGNNLNWSSSFDYIAYLFATVSGISKVGSYTGDGNTEQNIDCGFSSGARFVLIKKISSGGNWFWFDSERGIISGNSPYLELNTTSVESSSYNELSPYSSGFTVRNGGGLNLNFNGHTFIFYAIA